MARDPLEVLARLRRIELREAQRRFAEKAAMRQAAEARLAAAEQAPAIEAPQGEAADFAAWLPRALAEQARAGVALRQAETDAEAAREGVVAARVAENAIEALRKERALAVRREAQHRSQVSLDEAAARRR